MSEPRSGDWIQTYTGRKMYPLDPRPEDFNCRDIAHSLAFQCRFGGHVRNFYSIAEHCILLSYTVSPENALWALLHDATEAFVVDVPRPVKRMLTNYKEIEDNITKVMVEVYSLAPDMPEEVRDADYRILLTERNRLMHTYHEWSGEKEGFTPLELLFPIQCWEPHVAELWYLDRLEQLTDPQWSLDRETSLRDHVINQLHPIQKRIGWSWTAS